MSIKFSHKYDKMLDNYRKVIPEDSILLEVLRCKSEELHKSFIDYDTCFWDPKTQSAEKYKIPKGECIVLILLTAKIFQERMLWTTIRRYTPQKYEYYKKLRGKEFAIEIMEMRKS